MTLNPITRIPTLKMKGDHYLELGGFSQLTTQLRDEVRKGE